MTTVRGRVVGAGDASVELPDTVEQLCEDLQQQTQRHRELLRTMDAIRCHAHQLAESLPQSAEVLRPLMAAVGSHSSSSSSNVVVRATAVTKSATTGSVVAGKVVAASPARAVDGEEVKGTARRVVAATLKTTDAAAALDASSRQGGVDANVEVPVLRAELIASMAAQQVAESLRVEVSEAKMKVAQQAEQLAAHERQLEEDAAIRRGLEHELAELRQDGAAKDADEQQHDEDGGIPALAVDADAINLASLASRYRNEVAALRDGALQRQKELERCDYHRTRLQLRVDKLTKDSQLLTETKNHLEGQLQRLLMNSADESRCHSEAPSSSAAAAAPPPPPTAKEKPPVTSSAYNTSMLEKQVRDLRAMVDQLSQQQSSNSRADASKEEQMRSLQRENHDLQKKVQNLQRELRAKELSVMEREGCAVADASASAAAAKTKISALERECLRLGNLLQDRHNSARKKRDEELQELQLLRRRDCVLVRSNEGLLQRLTALQLKEVCRRGDGARDHTHRAIPDDECVDVAAAQHKHKQSPSPQLLSVVNAAAHNISSPARGTTATSPPPMATSSASHAAAAMDELREDYERQLEECRSVHRAEAKKLQLLNSELRQALHALRKKTSSAAEKHNAPLSTSSSFHLAAPQGGALDVRSPDRGAGRSTSRTLSDVVHNYDPETMTNWEAVQVENEALLMRVAALQQEKWSLTEQVEGLRHQARNNQRALAALAEPPKASHSTSDGAQYRSLQFLLQATLSDKMKLEEQLQSISRT